MMGTGQKFLNSIEDENGFNLIEVMISLAIVGSLLVTLIYTLNHHLDVVRKQETVTLATCLAKEKIYSMEINPVNSKGLFPEPYRNFSFETFTRESMFPGMMEISVTVKCEKEEAALSRLIIKGK